MEAMQMNGKATKLPRQGTRLLESNGGLRARSRPCSTHAGMFGWLLNLHKCFGSRRDQSPEPENQPPPPSEPEVQVGTPCKVVLMGSTAVLCVQPASCGLRGLLEGFAIVAEVLTLGRDVSDVGLHSVIAHSLLQTRPARLPTELCSSVCAIIFGLVVHAYEFLFGWFPLSHGQSKPPPACSCHRTEGGEASGMGPDESGLVQEDLTHVAVEEEPAWVRVERESQPGGQEATEDEAGKTPGSEGEAQKKPRFQR